jgi:hypothetical protein
MSTGSWILLVVAVMIASPIVVVFVHHKWKVLQSRQISTSEWRRRMQELNLGTRDSELKLDGRSR